MDNGGNIQNLIKVTSWSCGSGHISGTQGTKNINSGDHTVLIIWEEINLEDMYLTGHTLRIIQNETTITPISYLVQNSFLHFFECEPNTTIQVAYYTTYSGKDSSSYDICVLGL